MTHIQVSDNPSALAGYHLDLTEEEHEEHDND